MQLHSINAFEYFTHTIKLHKKIKVEQAKNEALKALKKQAKYFASQENAYFKITDSSKFVTCLWVFNKFRSKKIKVGLPVIRKKYQNKKLLGQIITCIEKAVKSLHPERVDIFNVYISDEGKQVFLKHGYKITSNQMIRRQNLKKINKINENIIFKKMNQAQFEKHCIHTANDKLLIRGIMDVGNSRKEAKLSIMQSFKELAPQKLADKNNYFFNVIDNSINKPIGTLWLTRFPKRDFLFISYIHIDSKFRGRGYGKKVMQNIDHFARRTKLSNIQLNVFETNEVAKKLYIKSGYKILYFCLCKKSV